MVSPSLLISSLSCLLHIMVTLLFFLPLNECVLKTCKNNGKLSLRDGKQVCICDFPFIGQICEDYACVNGLSTGEQFDPSSMFFNKRCLCDPGWTGELCDKSLTNRCGSNGKEKGGKCTCRKGFIGDRCQYVMKCLHGQLFNGRCQCHYGWSGDFCDNIICHEGEADEFNTKCICPSKYRGQFCDFCAAENTSPAPECAPLILPDSSRILNSESKPIILALVITISFVCIGLFCYIMCQKMSRRKAKISMENVKRTTADLENQLPEKFHEVCPLQSH